MMIFKCKDRDLKECCKVGFSDREPVFSGFYSLCAQCVVIQAKTILPPAMLARVHSQKLTDQWLNKMLVYHNKHFQYASCQ